MTTQYDPVMSPPVWDYALIGAFAELWLVQRLSGGPSMVDESLQRTYNAVDTPHVIRCRMKLLDRRQTLAYLEVVRWRALALLEEVDFDSEDPLLRGFLYDLVVQHEHQRDETILQELQLMPGQYLSPMLAPPPGRSVERDMVSVPGGRYPIGSDLHEPYDNEHPRHEVELHDFRIDHFPVSNGGYLHAMPDESVWHGPRWSGPCRSEPVCRLAWTEADRHGLGS